jgi:RNA polymerase sigma-70 factor (ECF subfamily)
MSACVTSVAGVNDLPSTSRSGADSLPNLVARAQAGDGEAFATLFEQHKKRVYSLCLLMTGDVADAEDLTQDAFIQVFRKLGTFRGDSAFSTWLYRVAVNTVLMSLRKRKPKQISLDEPVCIDHSFVPRDFGRNDPELSGTVDRIALIRAIKELPEGYRKIFLLHEVDGYQHHEIAAMLRCSVGNSKSQLHKAKLKIRELLMLEPDVPQNDKEAVPVQANAEVKMKVPVAAKLKSSFSDSDYFPDDLVSTETYTTIPMLEQRG